MLRDLHLTKILNGLSPQFGVVHCVLKCFLLIKITQILSRFH